MLEPRLGRDGNQLARPGEQDEAMHATTHTHTALDTVHQQRQALEQLRTGAIDTRAYLALARATAPLLAALPPRYAEVWHTLLDRLESAALFTEESCSFSPSDLWANLALWLDKAEGQLALPQTGEL